MQFQGLDDTGALGTLTRTGSAGNNGTTLSVVVPALARTGAVTVLGSGASLPLQIVPTLGAAGGIVAVGNTIVLEGTGLTANDLAIAIDGQGVGSFQVRTIIDGSSTTADQQLLTLTVPAGVGAGLITVSTAGGSSTMQDRRDDHGQRAADARQPMSATRWPARPTWRWATTAARSSAAPSAWPAAPAATTSTCTASTWSAATR